MSDSIDPIRDKIIDKMDIHLPGVIKTLGEAMYTDPWVAVRELIQNASDTCTVRRSPLSDSRQALDPQAPPAAIRIYYEPFEARLVVEDNGCGMTYEEVKKFLSVIGKSNTDDVRNQLESLGEISWADRLIGRFGLGLLSAFIIGQPIVFETRSYQPDSSTIWWQCDGGQNYEMGYLDVLREAGTRVTVYVDMAHRQMFKDEDKFIQMIKRYTDLLPIPIYLGKNGFRQINIMDAPWIRQGTVPEYTTYLQERFPDDSILHVMPVEIDEPATEASPALRLGGALFIPRQPDPLRAFVKEYGTVEVYVRRMFVTENEPALLPKWAKFVKGVVDSPDLRETTSRESIRHDESFARAQRALGQLILDNLRELALKDQRQFREIAAQHNVVIKAMAIAQPELFGAVRDIVLFKVENRVTSLSGYFKETNQVNLQPGQKRKIYYSSNVYGVGQHAFLFTQKGWRVIDASSYPDEPFLLAYAERFSDEVELVSVDVVGEHIFAKLEPKEEKWLNLEDAFLRNRIDATVVQYEPADIPAVLVDTKDERLSDDQLEQILKAEEVEQQVKLAFQEVKMARERRRRGMLASGAMLYLNADSEIIQRLADGRDLEAVDAVGALIVLYNNALMLSARALTADTAKVIFDGNNRTIKQLMDKTEEVKRLKEAGADPDTIRRLKVQNESLRTEIAGYEQGAALLKSQIQGATVERDQAVRALAERHREVESLKSELGSYRTPASEQKPYITCFVMLPYEGYGDVFDALQRILETKPYFWQVSRADHESRARKIDDNVKLWLDRSHCYIAEITDQRGSIMMELGYSYWKYTERPRLLLHKEDMPEPKATADLAGTIWAKYSWRSETPLSQRIQALKETIEKQRDFASLRGEKRFLSIHSMPSDISPEVGKRICAQYKTIEDYIQAVATDESNVCQTTDVKSHLVRYIRDELKTLAGN